MDEAISIGGGNESAYYVRPNQLLSNLVTNMHVGITDIVAKIKTIYIMKFTII